MICCPLSEGDGPSAFSSKTRRARKAHKCCECRGTIAAGEEYLYISGVWDGSPASFKTCSTCVEIRGHFACGAARGILGELWNELRENFLGEMFAGGPCLEGLSVRAKEALFAAKRKDMGL